MDQDGLYQLIRHMRQVKASDISGSPSLKPILFILPQFPSFKVLRFMALFPSIWYCHHFSARLSMLRHPGVLVVVQSASSVLVLKRGRVWQRRHHLDRF